MIDKLTTLSDFDQQIERLRIDIENDAIGAQRRLMSLVGENSIAPTLQKELALTNLQISIKHGEERKKEKEKLLSLLEAVIKDHREKNIINIAATRERTDARLAKLYVSRKHLAYRCTNLEKSYGNKFKLGPINLSIRKGEIYGVVGENGNGKTTLFKLIAGVTKSDRGEYEYPIFDENKNEKINWSKVKPKIAYVPQELPKWRGNLLEVLQYEAAIHGVKGDENDYEVNYIVERLGLSNYLDRDYNNLSGGYKFRFSLARALVWQPDLMILDEPLANLDVNAQLTVLNDIKAMATSWNNPIAVFMSSQHLHEVESVADSLLFLHKGKAIFNDKRHNLGKDRENNFFELDCDISMTDLHKALGNDMNAEIYRDGGHYTLITAIDTSAEKILESLLKSGIKINYFRDISFSTKRLFRELH